MAVPRSHSKVYDVVSYVIYCTEDATMMLVLESNKKAYWIPSSTVPPTASWSSQFSQDIYDVLGPGFGLSRVMRLYRVWVPKHAVSHIFHGVFAICITAEQKGRVKDNYGRYQGMVRWVDQAELTRMCSEHEVMSPELLEFMALARGEKDNDVDHRERVRCGFLTEITSKGLVTTYSTSHEQLLVAAGFTTEIQTYLYNEFILRCFPALHMCKHLFVEFVLNLGWTPNEAAHLFRIADLYGVGGLPFREFLYILAATEPSIAHTGTVAEIRCWYIFKFFDSGLDGLLDFTEFTNIIAAIRKGKSQSLSSAAVNQEAEACFKSIGCTPNVDSLTLNAFLSAVGSTRLRGTSQILRSSVSVVTYLSKVKEREAIGALSRPDKILAAVESKQGVLPKVSKEQASQNHAVRAISSNFEICTHTVKIKQGGKAIISVDQTLPTDPGKEKTDNQADSSKRLSLDVFDQKSVTNQILVGLRYLVEINKGKTLTMVGKSLKVEPYNWGQFNPSYFAQHLVAVCKAARDILVKEPRLLELKSPVYIMGDLHGSINDLLCFENAFWSLGPPLCPTTLLFLGDYIDRGYYGMEVLAYLLSYKLQAPKKLFMLRGNHEIREIQRSFSFQEEVSEKFGDKLGATVWDAINEALDALPLAAVVDSRIFCCHGGIPAPWLCPTVSAINSIPVPLSKPDTCSLAWEIMWNDPLKLIGKQIPQRTMMELIAQDGFATNDRRGTAHVFSTDALERFCLINGYSHVVRSHEVAEAGFNIQQKAMLVTVFSSSRYCGGPNEAACVLVDEGKLRILRLGQSEERTT